MLTSIITFFFPAYKVDEAASSDDSTEEHIDSDGQEMMDAINGEALIGCF